MLPSIITLNIQKKWPGIDFHSQTINYKLEFK